MNVKAEFAALKRFLPFNVFQDTEVRAADIAPLLKVLSERFGRQIVLKRRKPKKGWRISTIVGYVYHRQNEFSLLD